MLEFLAGLAQPWADLYSQSVPVEAAVVFLHLAALVVAGGLAIATDRAILRASAASPEVRGHVLADVRAAHRLVVAGLGILVVTGVLMLLADVADLLPSWFFWFKMLVFAALLVNGLMLRRAESQDSLVADPVAGRPLRAAAMRSTGLWIGLVFLGALLPMVA